LTKAMIATCRKGIGDLLYIPGTVIIPGTRVPMLHVQCTTRILQYMCVPGTHLNFVILYFLYHTPHTHTVHTCSHVVVPVEYTNSVRTPVLHVVPVHLFDS
jgi:hypothetical protein